LQASEQAATVVAISTGVATIELPGSGTLQVRGVAEIGQTVFARNGVIEGPEPIWQSSRRPTSRATMTLLTAGR
jgi:hypothetical protein